MTDKPKYSAEHIAKDYTKDLYPDELRRRAKKNLKESIESYANQEVKKACKEKDGEFFAELCVISIKNGKAQKEIIDKLKSMYAPSPQD